MARWGVCAEPGCPELTGQGRCDVHQVTGGWKTSTRRSRLPKDWDRRRRTVLRRDRNTCYLCGDWATAVDHVVNNDDHAFANLAAICQTCHTAKTQSEALEGRMNRRPRDDDL